MDKKLFALAAVSVMMMGAFCVLFSSADDSYAWSNGTPSAPLSSINCVASDFNHYRDVYVWVGSQINITDVSEDELEISFEEVTPGYGLSITFNSGGWWGRLLSGTVTKAGDIVVKTREITPYYDSYYYTTIHAYNRPVSCTVSFNANGGTASSSSATADQNTDIILPSASKAYSTFAGWYTSASGGTRVGGAGDTYRVTGNITLYAQYSAIPVSFTTVQDTAYVVQGSSFSYTAGTSPAGATLTVSGASWLIVSGNTVAGTASQMIAPGTYHVTLTASYGTQSAVQTFDIVVVEKLIFESVPTGGIIAIPV